MDNIKNKILIELEKADNTTDSFKDGMGKLLASLKADFRIRYINEIDNDDLEWSDIYIAVRPSTPLSVSICNEITKSKRVYIAFFDDDLLNYVSSLKWRRKNEYHCIREASLVMSSNPRLGEEYGKICKQKRFVIIDTSVNESELLAPHAIGEKIRIVYAAGRDHAQIFEKIARDALKRIIKEYGERVEMTFIGVKPRMGDMEDSACISYVPLMPLNEYRAYMDSHPFDIGLAPLEDEPFSSKKYFNKFFEYTTKGIMGIYSDCPPYTYVIKNQKNGVLVGNNPDQWYEILNEIISNRNLINTYVNEAQNTIRNRFSLETVAAAFADNIPELNQEIRKENINWKPPMLKYYVFLILDKSNKLFHQIKSRGFIGGFELVINHLLDKKKRG